MKLRSEIDYSRNFDRVRLMLLKRQLILEMARRLSAKAKREKDN